MSGMWGGVDSGEMQGGLPQLHLRVPDNLQLFGVLIAERVPEEDPTSLKCHFLHNPLVGREKFPPNPVKQIERKEKEKTRIFQFFKAESAFIL